MLLNGMPVFLDQITPGLALHYTVEISNKIKLL